MKTHSHLVFDHQLNHLLFYNFSVSTVEEMFGVCLIVFLLVFLYETIKVFRTRLSNFLESNEKKFRKECPSNACKKTIITKIRKYSVQSWKGVKFHVFQSSFYTVQTLLSYLIMLIVMTFNVWLIIAVILSSAFSFYMFGILLSRRASKVPIEMSSYKW